MKTRLTPMRAIRKKCLDCCCGNPYEVSRCTVTECPLFAYRTGQRPEGDVWYEDGRPEPTEEEKLRQIENGRRLIAIMRQNTNKENKA